MKLPIPLTFAPMEATLVDELPRHGEWQFEPKWDGFRCLAFREGRQIDLRSKSGRPLARYFPEVAQALAELDAPHFVLDGELVVPVDGQLSFDDLLQRIHPAASRILKLSKEHPAVYILFDLLVDVDGRSLVSRPLAERRPLLEAFVGRAVHDERFRLSPTTRDRRTVRSWNKALGGALDGIIAKRIDLPYQSGERTGMIKVKPIRTADCVVGGFRYASRGKVVGSLLLGLYDSKGLLNHVGFVANIPARDRPKLTRTLEEAIRPPGFTGRAPGGPSRWSTGRSEQWQPLAPKFVVEVAYDQVTKNRFRHGARWLRWRPDKKPAACLMDQIERPKGGLRLLHAARREKAKSR